MTDELLKLEHEAFERALRIRIWNDCKASNMKDDAAYRTISREIEQIKTEARTQTEGK